MDFGLAFSKEKRAMTAAGALLGRAAYMPPEQLAAEPTDRRADLYALGLTERLGLEDRGGFLRLGLVHYNTPEEIDQLVQALDEL